MSGDAGYTKDNERLIDGYRLVLTCVACPEQYDVFKGAEQVGYLRLRHGHFYASVPDVGGETVFEASPNGDGIFDDDERDGYLTQAVAAIRMKVERGIDLQRVRDAAPALLEALELADAALSGANMDMKVVERKVRAAIAAATGKQP